MTRDVPSSHVMIPTNLIPPDLREFFEPALCGECFVCRMAEVFRLVREVLADDGTLWLNLGDSYAHSTESLPPHRGERANRDQGGMGGGTRKGHGLKPKDLIGIPWRVAFALQADGWYLRSDIIWSKPNPMPESVTDRPTRAHEYLFLLSKRANYYYDCDAVREKTGNELSAEEYAARTAPGATWQSGGITRYAGAHKHDGGRSHPAGRNRRSVWTIPSEPYTGAHFATFPTKLVEPCILAGTSEQGHCPECGKRWVRVVERETFGKAPSNTKFDNTMQGGPLARSRKAYRAHGLEGPPPTVTTGWHPACDHGLDPIPDIVLDPFLGSGTVARVAQDLGRDWIGVDLNSTYEPMQKHRTAQMALVLGPSTAEIAT